jgi:phosphatidylglycerophosphatase A
MRKKTKTREIQQRVRASEMISRLCLEFASVLHIGFIPGAPGTYASIATTLVFSLVFFLSGRIPFGFHLSVICLISILGVLASANVSRNSGLEDPQYVVVDEVAGQLLTFLFIPVNPLNLVLGTILFRVFDMWKPFLIRKLESLGGGVGIMADDLLAGVYANLALQVINYSFQLLVSSY